jgi:homogentisate 1,2-dioxygenase
MTPHGPDTATFEAAVAPGAEAPSHLGWDTLAFMFETHATPRVTTAALSSPAIDRDYYRCAAGCVKRGLGCGGVRPCSMRNQHVLVRKAEHHS